MKRPLSLVLIVTAASTLAACSSDEGDPRPTAGAGGTGTGTAGTGAGGTGTAGTGTGGTGTAGTGAGGTGGAPVTYTYGTEYTITATGNVTDPGTTGVSGGAFLTQSANMTVPATMAHREGALCFSGSTAVVPDANSYGTYWGAELGLNLNLVPAAGGAAPAADAGADAGAVALAPAPWPYGNVIGFSYTLVGNDPAAPDQGVPPARLRFKALPEGADPMNDNYCSDRLATVDGKVENVLFSDISFECWSPGSLALDGPMINRVQLTPIRLPIAVANPRALLNVSWQIASDLAATTPAPIAFNFCIEDLKPIIGTTP